MVEGTVLVVHHVDKSCRARPNSAEKHGDPQSSPTNTRLVFEQEHRQWPTHNYLVEKESLFYWTRTALAKTYRRSRRTLLRHLGAHLSWLFAPLPPG